MLHSLSFADAVTAGALLALVIAAAITDIRSRKIPNWLTVSGMGGGLVLQTVVHGWSGLLAAMEGLLLGFGIYLVFYLIRAMGAGDVKLMAAVGAITGPVVWFNVFLATSVMSGLIALWLSLSTGRLRQTVWNVGYLVVELVHFRAPYYKHPDLDVKSEKALKMPHAVAIAAGVITCLVYSF